MRIIRLFMAAAALCAAAAGQVQLNYPLPDGAGVFSQRNLDAINGNFEQLTAQPLPAFNVTDVRFAGGAKVGTDASAAFLAAAKACANAGGGSVGYPAYGSLFPWQVSVTLPLASGCSWWPAPNSILDETAQVDLFESMALQNGVFVPVAGYAGGVITNPYATFGSGSLTGVVNSGIHCTGPCMFDGLIDQKTGSANDSKGVNYYGTSLHLSGHPLRFRAFHGDCIVADFTNTSPTSWGFSDIFDDYDLQYCGASPTTGVIAVAGAVGLVVAGPSDWRSTGRETSSNACWGLYVGKNAPAGQDQHFHDGAVNTNSTGCGIHLIEGPSYKATGGEIEGAVNVANVVDLSQTMTWQSGSLFTSGGAASQVPIFQFGVLTGDACFSRSLYCSTPGSPTPIAAGAVQFFATNTIISDAVDVSGNPGTNGAYYFRAEGSSYYGGSAVLTGGNYVGGALDAGSPSLTSLKGYGITTGTQACTGRITDCEPAVQTIGTGGTINNRPTGWANVPKSTVPITATGASTGVILQGGATGMSYTIVNTSTFTLALAASGSNCAAELVAKGIPPGLTTVKWDTGTSLWY